MITTIGKVLSFVLVVMSLIGLGLSIWVWLDRRNWDQEVKSLRDEIAQRQKDRDAEVQALAAVAAEIRQGRRQMPWTIDSADGAALTPQMLAVTQAKQELSKMEEENKKLQDQLSQLQVNHIQLISGLRDQRARTEAALALQKDLREQIEAHKFDGQVRPFRDVINEARTAKKAAEDQQEALRPSLVNALAELAIGLKRSEQLNRRREELKTGGQ